jgi:hypothetical protein
MAMATVLGISWLYHGYIMGISTTSSLKNPKFSSFFVFTGIGFGQPDLYLPPSGRVLALP